jgi:ketosteroid isomerase-like protein
MKIAIFTLAALFVAATQLAWAQEETSPSPASTPEVTAPESESSAKNPSVSVTTEKSPSAPEKSSSPAAPKKSSSPAAKSSSSPASTKTAPSPAPTKKMSPEASLRDLENRWEAAVMTHDTSVAAEVLGNDYVGVNSKGKLMNRASLMSEIKKDKDTYTSAKNGRMDVRIYGGQFGVVTGTSTEVGKDKDGKAFNRTYRWTDVWVDRKGKWQCVSSQANLAAR